jgi:hypothetical protein
MTTFSYAEDKPAIESVILKYNQHGSYSQELDITEVFTQGVSPVLSFNPS